MEKIIFWVNSNHYLIFTIIGTLNFIFIAGFLILWFRVKHWKKIAINNENWLADHMSTYITDSNRLRSELSGVRKTLFEKEKQIEGIETSYLTEINEHKVKIASLNSKIDVLNKTNTRLLKEVSDDITINVKSMDDANLNVAKLKRNYRKKNNGGSSTSKRTGKKGQ